MSIGGYIIGYFLLSCGFSFIFCSLESSGVAIVLVQWAPPCLTTAYLSPLTHSLTRPPACFARLPACLLAARDQYCHLVWSYGGEEGCTHIHSLAHSRTPLTHTAWWWSARRHTVLVVVVVVCRRRRSCLVVWLHALPSSFSAAATSTSSSSSSEHHVACSPHCCCHRRHRRRLQCLRLLFWDFGLLPLGPLLSPLLLPLLLQPSLLLLFASFSFSRCSQSSTNKRVTSPFVHNLLSDRSWIWFSCHLLAHRFSHRHRQISDRFAFSIPTASLSSDSFSDSSSTGECSCGYMISEQW